MPVKVSFSATASGTNTYASISAYVPENAYVIGLSVKNGAAYNSFRTSSGGWYISNQNGSSGWSITGELIYVTF